MRSPKKRSPECFRDEHFEDDRNDVIGLYRQILNKLKGIIEVKASYEKARAKARFDSSKTSVDEITKAINATGYRVTSAIIK